MENRTQEAERRILHRYSRCMLLAAFCVPLLAVLNCSDAPKLTRQGNRTALVELFTQTG